MRPVPAQALRDLGELSVLRAQAAPGYLLVVEARAQAAVQERDQAVGEGEQCLVVPVAERPPLLVVRPAPGTPMERADAHMCIAS